MMQPIEKRPTVDQEQEAPAPSVEIDQLGPSDLSAVQAGELANEAKQTEYRRQYLLQLRQRECPGCGDSPIF